MALVTMSVAEHVVTVKDVELRRKVKSAFHTKNALLTIAQLLATTIQKQPR